MIKRNWYITCSFFVLLLLIVLFKRSFISASLFERNVSYVLYPILVIQDKIVAPFKGFLQGRQHAKDLFERYNKLRDEADSVVQENIALTATFAYYHDVKELVHFKERYMHNGGVVAHILLKHMNDQSHYALIDAGTNKGITTDMVATHKNCIIGKVIESYPLYSKIMLATDSNFKIAIYCAKTKTKGIYKGSNQVNVASLDKVSHLETIKNGDFLISSGQGMVFPQGFGLGTIKEHSIDNLFYSIVVEPFMDMEHLSYCTIIANNTKL